MTKSSTKPLLQWLKGGDPDLVPMMMSAGISTAASYFGVPVRSKEDSVNFSGVSKTPVSPDMVLQCSRETGIHFVACLGGFTPFDVVEFMDDVHMHVDQELDDSGAIRKVTTITTPAGEMSDVFLTPPDLPACWLEHLIKTEGDLSAFVHLIERTNQILVENDEARSKITAGFQAEAAKWPSHVPLYVIVGVPTFSLTSNLYMDPSSAFFILEDHKSLMERLFEIEARTNAIVLECASKAGADIVKGAINGLELFSPQLFERYFTPQSQVLSKAAHTHGMLNWVHTCGFMKKLISMDVYGNMNIDVLETLSHPPLGDVDDLHGARAKLGPDITTRGAVNVDLFYSKDHNSLRDRIKTVLKETEGYRHMIGDSNDTYPPYTRDTILAFVDEVRKSGRVLPT